ncbi:coiled-coil domain-containing protein 3-like [Branchiostoma floridae x Branchiostoma belcheri]
MQRCFLLSLAAAVLVVAPACGCQPPGWAPWNITYRVQQAEMVVWGRVVAKHGLKTPPATSYTAEVAYGCHVKGDSAALHPRFNITKMGHEGPGQCVSHDVDIGSYYFFFLTWGEEEVLIPQDMNLEPGVLPDTTENRLEFSLCCGFTLSVCQPDQLTTSQPMTVPQTTSQPQTTSRTTNQPQTIPDGTNPAGPTVAMTTVNVSMTTQSMMTTPDIAVGGASRLGVSTILVLLSALVVAGHLTV